MPATTTLEDRIHIMESSEAGEPAWRIAQRLRWRLLIGLHPAFLDLQAFQLCLPFLPEELNVTRLFELTADTT